MKKYLFLFLIIVLGAFLRLYAINSNPPGLYIDEISDAYNANEIIAKGVDQYGEKYPLWFKAFGEYKMPMLVYTEAVSIAILGRTDFAVRMPSAISGILSLIVFYFLVKELLEFTKNKLPWSSSSFALCATFMLSISPWHIQFSRGGFDATVGLFIFLLAMLFAVIAYKKQKLGYLILSFLFLGLTMYSYNVYRLTAPIVFIAILAAFVIKQKKRTRELIISGLFFLVIILPVILFSLTGAGMERFSETSAFAPLIRLPLFEKFLQYPMIYLKNYFSYFSLQFLFNFGDGIGRHQMSNFGLIQYWELPFLISGLFFFIKNLKNSFYRIIILLLLLSPVSASLAVPSPHALRSLLMIIPLSVIATYGILWSIEKLRRGKRVILICISLLVIIYEASFYLHFYYSHYPIINSLDWGAGNKEVVEKAIKYNSGFKHLVIDKKLGTSTIPLYFGFYSNDSIQPLIVSASWKKPDDWSKGTTLYIRSNSKKKINAEIIDTVYLTGNNRDIFAQFIKL